MFGAVSALFVSALYHDPRLARPQAIVREPAHLKIGGSSTAVFLLICMVLSPAMYEASNNTNTPLPPIAN